MCKSVNKTCTRIGAGRVQESQRDSARPSVGRTQRPECSGTRAHSVRAVTMLRQRPPSRAWNEPRWWSAAADVGVGRPERRWYTSARRGVRTRTTRTSTPLASNPLGKAAPNVACLHSGGAYVHRIPKLGDPKNPWPTTGTVDGRNIGEVIKVIPTAVVDLRVRSSDCPAQATVRQATAPRGQRQTADSSRTSWAPN